MCVDQTSGNNYEHRRQWVENKRSTISENIPPILNRLNIETKHCLYLTKNFESPFKGLIRSVEKPKQDCQNSVMNERR